MQTTQIWLLSATWFITRTGEGIFPMCGGCGCAIVLFDGKKRKKKPPACNDIEARMQCQGVVRLGGEAYINLDGCSRRVSTVKYRVFCSGSVFHLCLLMFEQFRLYFHLKMISQPKRQQESAQVSLTRIFLKRWLQIACCVWFQAGYRKLAACNQLLTGLPRFNTTILQQWDSTYRIDM